jgi:glycosyltransferase involved in cell wall biosynthesis
MDVYPDVATDLDYFKAGGIIDGMTGALADYSRRHADGIIALGECMKQRLIRRGIDGARIFVADNWADGTSIQPLPRSGDPAQLVLLYSGNLGLAHDLDTLTGAILSLSVDPRFIFIFVGSGGRRAELQSFASAHNLSSIELRPYVDRTTLGESLSVGDIGLVTQRNVCCGSVVPSKVYGILAAGRPILYIGPREATPARIIHRFNCGWQVDCGEIDGLTRLLLHLANHPEEVALAGRNGRDALLQHYDLPLGVERIVNILGAGSAIRASSVSPSIVTVRPT